MSIYVLQSHKLVFFFGVAFVSVVGVIESAYFRFHPHADFELTALRIGSPWWVDKRFVTKTRVGMQRVECLW